MRCRRTSERSTANSTNLGSWASTGCPAGRRLRMNRASLRTEQIEDAQEVVDVLELLDGLAREEPRRVEIGRLVQPMAALDAGDLAVQELVDDPAEQGAVALRRQASRPEIERHFLARKQHRSGA